MNRVARLNERQQVMTRRWRGTKIRPPALVIFARGPPEAAPVTGQSAAGEEKAAERKVGEKSLDREKSREGESL